MDKATVLEYATNYIGELQDRAKELEGLSLIKRKETKDCIIASGRSRIRRDDDGALSSNETNSVDCGANVTNKSSVEIEVRMSGSSVLVRIQSQKNPSLLVKVLSKMQKLGLSIISSNAMPFANTTTFITIIAQVNVLHTNHFTMRKMSPSLWCFLWILNLQATCHKFEPTQVYQKNPTFSRVIGRVGLEQINI
ncbi:hypothetical protein Hdeb2414_s0003g00084561 [Helianthus debilis subsp. tardiflorus]